MITYLIIDDEHIAHDIIKNYCDLLPNMQLMKNCYDGLEAFEYLNKNEVNLMFLDLNMPKLKGFDFLKTLRNPPKVIVTTAYKEFALEGYELNISDYLLKPFGFERFLKAINKTFSTSITQEVVPSKNNVVSKRIFLRSNKKYTQVEIDTILFIEASGNYTKVITTQEIITIREKISSVLDLLPKEDFLQVHKSFAVAPKHIKSIEGNRIFISDHIIPIGKVFRTNIVQLLQ
ncbi:response regulator transcription factor [Winogradskyella echinorum]|uniref:Response regulator transcription factor n=1 Tax=Winogradskyella echinorum TaxID=538189 RepID=A0ABR6Y243_9FLAO|nr:LytTR family DNA-binding domain-containing protein [Winogradskyella echinorum]MBC3846817.1 response regulator transcription factor [Winogradskyella echinorum]MBC5751165.1 response regulator transcription factor [Winogradskyella echinorum]